MPARCQVGPCDPISSIEDLRAPERDVPGDDRAPVGRSRSRTSRRGPGSDAHVVEPARSPARDRPVADAVVGDRGARGDRRRRGRRRRTAEAWAWRATLDSASRRHSRRWLRVGSSTALSIGPWMSHDGLNPSVVAASSQTARMSPRRLATAERRWLSSKIVERIWRIDTLRSSTAPHDPFDGQPDPSTICAAACSDSPVAKSRWMTSSWRSRAIRSRSSSSPAARACSWRRAFSMASAGGGGQPDGELLIDVGEHLAVGLVRQVEVAVDDAARAGSARRGTTSSAGGRAGTRSCRDGRADPADAAASGRGSAGRGCRDPPDGRRCGPSPRR